MRTYEIHYSIGNNNYRSRVDAPNKESAEKTLSAYYRGQAKISSIKHIKKNPNPDRFYVCYGSNLNVAQMTFRCPDAKIYGAGVIKDYKLSFYNVASIDPETGTDCPVGVWKISEDDERSLDRYEGWPRLYRKEMIPVVMESGETIEAMVYIMNCSGTESAPSRQYYQTIYDGYENFGLDLNYLTDSVKKFRRNTQTA